MIWRPAQPQIPHQRYQTALTQHGRFFAAFKDGSWEFMPPDGEWQSGGWDETECKQKAEEWYVAME